jgi:hypothetical protein
MFSFIKHLSKTFCINQYDNYFYSLEVNCFVIEIWQQHVASIYVHTEVINLPKIVVKSIHLTII